MLRPFAGDRSKRAIHGAHTPCAELKRQVTCSDLCCRNFLVLLAQEDLDDGLQPLPPFVDVLLKHERGHCHYFDEKTTQCTVHEKRPQPCRVFDCRDDARANALRYHLNPDQPFVTAQSRTCEGCGKELRLSAAVSAACDSHSVCLGCGAGYTVDFNYGQRFFAITYAPDVTPQKRRVYLMRALAYHHRFAEALPLAEALAIELPTDESVAIELGAILVELGRYDEGRAVFERLGSPEATLELAWSERRQGKLDEARARLEQVFAQLSLSSRVRAVVELGRIAQRRGELDVAARWFVIALQGRVLMRNDPMLKEFVLELLRGSPEGKAAVERVVLQGGRGTPPP